MITKQEIREWFVRPFFAKGEKRLKNMCGKKRITHMLVVCDDFDYQDYPVYVTRAENVREVYNKYDGKNMQRVIEVYSYNHGLEEQLNEERAVHYD